MKYKIITLLLMPLAFSMALAVNAQAKSHKLRVKMTGCLEPGTTPNTFVLNNITKGYTRRNTTGQAPLALARTEDIVLVPERSKVDIQKHVGQRVRISGWTNGTGYTTSSTTVTTTPYGTEVAPTTTTDVSEFRVTKIHKLSGSCQ